MDDATLSRVSVRRCAGHAQAGHIRGGAGHAVYQTPSCVNADVRLHAKAPVVTLLGLVHLGITFAFGVLGRNRQALEVDRQRHSLHLTRASAASIS